MNFDGKRSIAVKLPLAEPPVRWGILPPMRQRWAVSSLVLSLAEHGFDHES
jgi:hypothetical protein